MTSPGNPVPLQSFPLSFSLSLSHSLFFSRLDGGGGLSLSLSTVSSQVLLFSLFPSGDKEKREGERETNEIKKKEKKEATGQMELKENFIQVCLMPTKRFFLFFIASKRHFFFGTKKKCAKTRVVFCHFRLRRQKKEPTDRGALSPPPPKTVRVPLPTNPSFRPSLSFFFAQHAV